MRDFVEKYFCTRFKKTDRNLKNGEKKWFPLARKPVSPTMNKLPLDGIFFKNWILPDFNNVSISRNKFNFKNWIPPNFHYQEVIFSKIWFFLISLMVSTSRNKSCKILSCLGEIVFFYSEFFDSGNHYRNVEANF